MYVGKSIALLILLNCLPLQAMAETTGEITQVQVERTGCPRGKCPAYTITVRSDGSVQYDGATDVKITGVAQGSVSSPDWKILEAAVQSAEFFSMQDQYTSEGCTSVWNHHPTINMSVTRGGTTKRVSYYTGCWGLREGRLIAWLADTTDMVSVSVKWVHETLEDGF